MAKPILNPDPSRGDIIATPYVIEEFTDENVSGDHSPYRAIMFTHADPCVGVAIGFKGEAFPRLLLNPSTTGDGFLWFGDGTYDPRDGGGIYLYNPAFLPAPIANALVCGSTDNNQALNGFFLFTSNAGGPVLTAPDNSRHRVVVANDGTLSTVPLV